MWFIVNKQALLLQDLNWRERLALQHLSSLFSKDVGFYILIEQAQAMRYSVPMFLYAVSTNFIILSGN